MEDEKKFLKGFNAGYLIAKHNPELSKKLKQGLSESDNALVQGFLSGTQELKKEMFLEKMRNASKETQRDIEDKGFEM